MRKSGLVVVLSVLGPVAVAESWDPPRREPTSFELRPVTVAFTVGAELGWALGFRLGYAPPPLRAVSLELVAGRGLQETFGVEALWRPLALHFDHSPSVRLGVLRGDAFDLSGPSWLELREVLFVGWESRFRAGVLFRVEAGPVFREALPDASGRRQFTVRVDPALSVTFGFPL